MSREIVSSEKNKQLSEAYKQLPLGVTIRDYSGVKQRVTQLVNDGVQDLGQYLNDNPDVLFEMVMLTETIDANDSMLRLYRVNSMQEYLDLDANFEHWKNTGWAEFYCQQFIDFADGKSHFGDFLELAADGTPIETRGFAWIPEEHEDDWSLVITTHEDITHKRQAEEKLRERDLQIDQAVRLANMGTWIWDFTKDEYEYASPEVAKIYGYEVDDLPAISKDSGSYLLGVHPDDVAHVIQEIDKSIQNHEIYQATYRIIQKDGAVRTVRDTSQHFYNSDGTCYRSIGCMQDISDLTAIQDELYRAQVRYQWAADIGKMGHYVWDNITNQCEYCSPELAEMCGMSLETYIELSMTHDTNIELVHPDDREMYAAIARDQTQDLDVVFRTIRADGTVLYLHEYGRRTRDDKGRTIRTNGIIRDITQEKNAEWVLQAALAEAEQANRAKSEFLATMSHELRTPLNAITGFAQMMIDEVFGKHHSSKYQEYSKDIKSSGDHLLTVINDILDLSKIEAGEISFTEESFGIREVVEDCANMLRQRRMGHSERFDTDHISRALRLNGDKRLFKQIILNLLTNASKFTRRDGVISTVSELDTENRIVVKVIDEGKGIAPSDLSKALEPFGQVKADSYVTHEGTGLGLPLSQKLMELHGGTLELESELGVGTTVTLTFPAERTV